MEQQTTIIMAFKGNKMGKSCGENAGFPKGGSYNASWPLNGKGSQKGYGNPMLNMKKKMK